MSSARMYVISVFMTNAYQKNALHSKDNSEVVLKRPNLESNLPSRADICVCFHFCLIVCTSPKHLVLSFIADYKVFLDVQV